jgi:hypothetical protein
MPNKKTVVQTNSIPGSVKQVELRVLTFKELWNNYPSGDPYNDPTGEYKNQCAIRMSVTFHRVGSEMKSFSQKLIKPMPGKLTLGRLLLDGKPTATRAYELAEWLKLRPFAELPNRCRLGIKGRGSNGYYLLLRLLAAGRGLAGQSERRPH